MLPAAKRLFILFHAGLMWTISKAEASYCTKDQVTKCKNAALDNTLDKLLAGGVCKPARYVEYTHQCVVDSYLLSDYCCCAYEQRVFCCRYHYVGPQFRCNEAEDTIHVLSDKTTVAVTPATNHEQSTTWMPLAIEILIPAIVVPSVAMLCFLFYCIKCCCCHDDDDDEGRCCDIFSRCQCRRRKKKSAVARHEEHYLPAHDNQRSNLLPASLKESSISNSSSKTSSEKCDNLLDIKYPPLEPPRTEPTAPPYEVRSSEQVDSPPPYNPGLYDPVLIVSGRTANGILPYIQSVGEVGRDVIYQPVLAHAHIPLPVTKLSEQTQTVGAAEVDTAFTSAAHTDDAGPS